MTELEQARAKIAELERVIEAHNAEIERLRIASLTYYIDIDGTICNTTGEDYANAQPIQANIDKANALHQAGHRVVYWTARGAGSGKDWWYLTMKQLRDWGCEFDELSFDKPVFDVVIDDRARRWGEV